MLTKHETVWLFPTSLSFPSLVYLQHSTKSVAPASVQQLHSTQQATDALWYCGRQGFQTNVSPATPQGAQKFWINAQTPQTGNRPRKILCMLILLKCSLAFGKTHFKTSRATFLRLRICQLTCITNSKSPTQKSLYHYCWNHQTWLVVVLIQKYSLRLPTKFRRIISQI